MFKFGLSSSAALIGRSKGYKSVFSRLREKLNLINDLMAGKIAELEAQRLDIVNNQQELEAEIKSNDSTVKNIDKIIGK